MDWVEGMNRAIEYIEDNLAAAVDQKAAARIAACSEFHFQRMFAFITGVSVSEYIRRRRMTCAAFDLMDGNSKVLDVALKYGYDSPTSFNRAFRAVHGVSPSRARAEGIELTSYPRITFTLSVKGERAMDYKIVCKEAFRIVGYATHEAMTMEDCFEKVPLFWQNVAEGGGMEKLCGLMQGKEPCGILGVSSCDNGEYSGYYIAVATDAPVPEGMEEYVIPKTTYAVFEAIGPSPQAVQEMQQRIVSEWLPASGYEYAPAADVEVYPAGDQQSNDYRTEIWLPIIKK
ncbi:MAG: AraC family transcriptional regulator [Oscillospiraceae bacterium]|nr:AraC family transcriptional regulator [Oscillospiraceae bacterium]